MPLPSGVEIRKSCEGCSFAKVKCSSDKPSCKRCKDRGLSCQYLVTQRTGRKPRHENVRQSVNCNSLVAEDDSPTPSITFASSSSSMSTTMLQSPLGTLTHFQIAPDTVNMDAEMEMDSSACINDFLAPLPLPPVFSSSDGWVSLSSTHASSPSTMISPNNVREPFTWAENGGANSNRSIFSETPTIPNDDGPRSLDFVTSATPYSDGANNNNNSGSSTADSSPSSSLFSQSLIRIATQLLEQISKDDNLTLRSLSPKVRLERISARSHQALRVVDNTILESLGCQDGHIVVLVCLIIHRILSLYLSAVHSSSTTVGEDLVVLRRVLDELFRVRSSISALGGRIHFMAESSRLHTRLHTRDGKLSPTDSPISTITLSNLHTELHNRLSNVSIELLEDLKKFWA